MKIHGVVSLAAVTLFAAAALAVEPSAPASSGLPAQPECPAIDAAVEPLPLGADLRAYIDPVTGRLRQPTADELAAAAASSRLARNKSIEGLEVEYRADGSKHVDLQGRFMHSLNVTRNADGTTSYVCTDREPHSHPPSNQPAASAAPAEK